MPACAKTLQGVFCFGQDRLDFFNLKMAEPEKKRRGRPRQVEEPEADTDQTAPEFSSSAAPVASSIYESAWAGPRFFPETPPPKKARKNRDLASLGILAHESRYLSPTLVPPTPPTPHEIVDARNGLRSRSVAGLEPQWA